MPSHDQPIPLVRSAEREGRRVTVVEFLAQHAAIAMSRAIRLLMERTGWSYDTVASQLRKRYPWDFHRTTIKKWADTGRVGGPERAHLLSLLSEHGIFLELQPTEPGKDRESSEGHFRTDPRDIQSIDGLTRLEIDLDIAQHVAAVSRFQITAHLIGWLREMPRLSDAERDILARVLAKLAGQHNAHPVSQDCHAKAQSLLELAMTLAPRFSRARATALHELGLTNHNLGLANQSSEQLHAARKAFDAARRVAISIRDVELEAAVAADLSRLIATTGGRGGSLQYAERAVRLAAEAQSARSHFTARLAQSLALIAREDSDGAVEALEHAVKSFGRLENPQIPPLWRYLWYVHRGLAKSVGRDPDDAGREIDAALVVAASAGVPAWISSANRLAELVDSPRKMRWAYCESP